MMITFGDILRGDSLDFFNEAPSGVPEPDNYDPEDDDKKEEENKEEDDEEKEEEDTPAPNPTPTSAPSTGGVPEPDNYDDNEEDNDTTEYNGGG